MNRSFKKLLSIFTSLIILLPLFPLSQAQASDITSRTVLTVQGFPSRDFLTDGDLLHYERSTGSASITLENRQGIHKLYLLFGQEYGAYTVTDRASGASITAGTQGFLHELIDLTEAFGAAPESVTLTFHQGSVSLSEIQVFGQGALPDHVQDWSAPLEQEADLVLFSAHGDDEHLFFAGLLPLYAGERGMKVQVVYMTDHRNVTNERVHEMLNGLWAVGVTAYPVFGPFEDFRVDDLEGTYETYERMNVTREDLLSFVVAQIRRFKPLVAVGHDIRGEYGHGMHMVYTDLLIRSLELTNDPDAFSDSAERYGTWEIRKLYLHLCEENEIVLDYDQPLDRFDGMTAFQVSQKLGYPCHLSQQKTWFTSWLNGDQGQITKASQIKTYDPRRFGLYHSTVGPDVEKKDLFENISLREGPAEPPQTDPTQPPTDQTAPDPSISEPSNTEPSLSTPPISEPSEQTPEQSQSQSITALPSPEDPERTGPGPTLLALLALACALVLLLRKIRKRPHR